MPEPDRKMIPIAVVGMSALFPGSTEARGFWADILAGRDLVTEVPPSHWLIEDYYDPDPAAPDKTYCKRGAFLSAVDFDPLEFGIPPGIVPATDTSQILALIVAQKVLEDASQGQFASMDRERISVVLGVTSGQQLLGSMVSRLQRPIWTRALRESGLPETEVQAICDRIAKNYVPWQESSFPGLLGNVVAGRIANRFDLHGTNAVTDAACASSIAALSMGISELQLGQSDLVISGGVDTMNDIFMYMCFSKTPALSPTGDCRPFSDNADGTLLGEGICMMALKRLTDAERDGDRVYAVIRGIGSSSDGRSRSVYAPVPEGQARALRRAYAAAGYGPETVELVEAHGTATKAGDAAEFEGLRMAFAESGRTDSQWCALGSVKSQIGHTKAAAGAAGLFKAIMALHHKVLPPTIKIERPNPTLDLEHSAFYLNTQPRPWIRDGSHPRRASVSSFGFGGSNYHVTLEEYVPGEGKGKVAWRFRTAPTELVLLSEPTVGELLTRSRALAENPGNLVQTARESQERFSAADGARLAVVAANSADLSEKLLQAVAAIAKAPACSFVTPTGTCYGAGTANAGEVAFLFPGQGSQYAGMGADVAMSIDAAREVWNRAASARFDGESIHHVVFPPAVFTDDGRAAQDRKLTATEWAQVALGVHSVSLMKVLHSLGLRPACVAGHSFGEITALHAAGAFDEETLIKIARRRGELMRDASAIPGAMTAVACSIDKVQPLLDRVDGNVVIANYNAPAQCVLSGATAAIARVEDSLAAAGITARRLPVATAFHSPLVASSSERFRDYLSALDVTSPAIDVYGNADGATYPRDPHAIRERLAGHIAQPVRFVDQVEAMYARGVRSFIEVGAGSVLTELVDRILGDREHYAVNLDRKGVHGLTTLHGALGRLAVAGVPLEFGALWAGYAPLSDKPAKKPAMAMPISGASYGKPYPPPGGAKDLPPPNPPREVREVKEIRVEAPPPQSDIREAWVRAYQEAQRQTAEAHAAYQRATAESHAAFLKTAEASFASLSALLTGDHRIPAAVPAPLPLPELPILNPDREEVVVNTSPPVIPDPVVSDTKDLEALLLAVVSEKTGYPAEMLGAQMELESDLGIDSIKRVEILSAMSECAPGLREVKMTDFAALRTLGQIVEHMRAQESGAPPVSRENKSGPGEGDIQRFALREVDTPAVGMALPGILSAKRMVVTDDGAGLADLLVASLARRGVEASIVSEVPSEATSVIFLGGMRVVTDVEEALAVNREAFRAARAVAARFAADSGGVFVTVQDTGGDFGLSGQCGTRGWLGGISALTRTAALEWPHASVKTIDCECGGRDLASLADAICTELFEGGPSLEVGLRADGRRTTLASIPVPLQSAGSTRFRPDSVIVASGGGRGITAAALIALARKHQPRILLLGRTPLDDATAGTAVGEIRSSLAELAAAGSAARYMAVNIQDAAAVAAALDTVRREWGPITAIVHGAGVLADKRIVDKTDEQFDRVFDTKIDGLRALLAATAHDPLSAVCLFSSMAARTGNPGQCDYAMANEVLNLVACAESARRGKACLVRSIGWGPWEGGMVTPGLRTHFRQMGVALIPIELGAEIFAEEMNSAGDDVVVVVGGTLGYGSLGASVSPAIRAEVQVNARSHTFLNDHRIDGTAVVPVVMAVEWMLRGARACRPDLMPGALRNVRVLSGIRLDHFEEAGDVFVVNCRQTSDGAGPEIAVELRRRSGALHYSGVAAMATRTPVAPPVPAAPRMERWTQAEIYDGHVLFHRERFQAIRSLEGISDKGIVGTLAGARELGWSPDAWCTDPAVLDGGFQLAGLWTRHVLGGASLPMSFGELRTYRCGLAEGAVRCVVHARQVHDAHSVCDVSFADANGTLIAEMIGVQSVLRPDRYEVGTAASAQA